MSQFFVEFFCLGAPKNIAWNPFVLCFGMFQLAIDFMDKKGGVSNFSCENFVSHSAEKFRRGTF